MRNFISNHNVKLFSLLETRVKPHNLGKVYLNLCPGWCFTHNLHCHDNGRIVVGWCPVAFTVNVIQVDSQFIHCMVKPKNGVEFGCTFVYGFNDANSRMGLWSGLRSIHRTPASPWVLLGDFNALSNVEDRVGSMVRLSEIKPMLECIRFCSLVDVKASG